MARRPNGEKSNGEKSNGEKSNGEKSNGEKSNGEKSNGEKSEQRDVRTARQQTRAKGLLRFSGIPQVMCRGTVAGSPSICFAVVKSRHSEVSPF